MAQDKMTPLEKAHENLFRAQTDLHKTRQQSQRNADYLQAVLNHSPAAIGFVKAVFDNPDPLHGDPATDPITDYRLVAVNEKFALLVGEPVGQLTGQSATHLADLLWHDDTYATFYRIITEDAVRYEEREYEEAGQTHWLRISAVKHDGGVVLTGLEITELRQAQQQREALLQQVDESAGTVAQLAALRQQLTDRGELLRVYSHDLRSNLGVVLGATQLLNFSESDGERVQIMEMLNRNVRELARLLTELVEQSTIKD